MKNVTIGIDIGGTNTVFGIVDYKGNCIVEGSLSTKKYKEVNDFISALAKKINSLLKKQTGISLKGIGIGAPNGNYFKGTIEHAPNLDWKGIIPFAELLSQHFDVPIALTNDANAAALGEMIYGDAKGMKDFILITLGTGLGSGIVVNGDLVYGHDGFAGEIGHTIVDPLGRKCGCGRKGCLETYASATGIVTTVKEFLAASNEESLLRYIPDEKLDARAIHNAAKDKDIIALKAFGFTGKILGMKLADAVAHTSPSAIFLFGGLANAGEFIFEPVRNYFEKYLLGIYKNKIKIHPSGLDSGKAAILGASALIRKELEKKGDV